MVFRAATALLLAVSLTACANLPSSAPTAREFSHSAPAEHAPSFAIIDLDPHVVEALASFPYPGLATALGKSDYKPTLAFMPGDVVAITIFDVSAQPLLGNGAGGGDSTAASPPISGHSTALPSQVVELDGTVKIPFAGTVEIAGLNPTEAAHKIERSLKGQAKAPQAVVTRVSSALDAVTVGGDVEHPGLIPLTVRGERVLDAIAAAGGAKFESYDCDVQLVRHLLTVKAPLQDIVDRPTDNVTLQPGDSLYVSHYPHTFSVLGSAMKVSQINFDAEKVTLAEAIARSGGPSDSLANIQNVYLLRYETEGLVDALSTPTGSRPADAGAPKGRLPVAYHLNLRHGGGYFLAQAVQIHDKDVILMTDANADQLGKLFVLLRGATGIYYDVKNVTVH